MPNTNAPQRDSTGLGKVAHEVRCTCHALQFISVSAWVECSVGEAELVIKCWRRTCRRILPLRKSKEC